MEASPTRLKTSATSTTTTTTSTSLSAVDHRHQQRSNSDGSIGHVHHPESSKGGAMTRGLFSEENTSKPSSNNLNTVSFGKEENEIKLAKAEMVEVREENARLKMLLGKIEKEYQTLQTRFTGIIHQQPKKVNTTPSSITHEEDTEGLSLCLGRTQSEPKREEITSSSSKNKETEELKEGDDLKLGLSYSELKSEQSPDNSLEVVEKDEQTWPPSKASKNSRSEDQDELLAQQASVKRARVSVRTRCDTPTMNDGCQWRKYGQKISKGNPCPRAYYRCTVAPACPVRKQVQRCVEDMSILITTYEGTHNHPLPIAATAMASTTSAAASMLLSGSSTSQPGLSSSATALPSNLQGLNFNLSNNSRPFYSQQNPSGSQVSPTITLDLTSNPNPNNPFSMFPSTTRSSFPSTSLNFSSPEPNNFWGNGALNYGTLPYNKANVGSFNIGRPLQEQYYQPYTERNNNQASSQQLFTETLTKVITTDPSFRSVIATAISSMVGRNQSGADKDFGQNLNSNPLSGSTKICSSNFLNRTSSLNSQTGSLMLLQQAQLPFSLAKNTSAANTERGEQIN